MSAKKHMIGLDDELVQQAAEVLGLSSIRDTIGWAVRNKLTIVKERLFAAGLVPRPTVARKLRTIDDRDWTLLVEAGKEVPLGVVELIRACLVLTTRDQPKTGD